MVDPIEPPRTEKDEGQRNDPSQPKVDEEKSSHEGELVEEKTEEAGSLDPKLARKPGGITQGDSDHRELRREEFEEQKPEPPEDEEERFQPETHPLPPQ